MPWPEFSWQAFERGGLDGMVLALYELPIAAFLAVLTAPAIWLLTWREIKSLKTCGSAAKS